jgi:hypothetical protein
MYTVMLRWIVQSPASDGLVRRLALPRWAALLLLCLVACEGSASRASAPSTAEPRPPAPAQTTSAVAEPSTPPPPSAAPAEPAATVEPPTPAAPPHEPGQPQAKKGLRVIHPRPGEAGCIEMVGSCTPPPNSLCTTNAFYLDCGARATPPKSREELQCVCP